MPRASGNLRDEIQSGKSGDRSWVVKTFTSVLDGMAYAHSKCEALHRDLKPENVLIVEGVPVISDFGLGKQLDPNITQGLTSANIGLGTLEYMAPEQVNDAANAGTPADVYSLGKLLGEMLTGDRPMFGRPRLSDYPDEFRSFIDRCTQDRPEDRYANASDALAAFQLLVSGSGDTGAASGTEFEDLIRAWESAPLGQDDGELSAVAVHLVSRRNDEEFYFKVIPRIPPDLIKQLIERRPGDFAIVLGEYDRHIDGSLPFEYCDVVANFYANVYRQVDETGQKRMIIRRLIHVGPEHNRWHVGDVLGNLFAELTGSDALIAAEELLRQPRHAAWFTPYVESRKMASSIVEAIGRVNQSSSIDAIPF
jgi:serine/threonine protein kinase